MMEAARFHAFIFISHFEQTNYTSHLSIVRLFTFANSPQTLCPRPLSQNTFDSAFLLHSSRRAVLCVGRLARPQRRSIQGDPLFRETPLCHKPLERHQPSPTPENARPTRPS